MRISYYGNPWIGMFIKTNDRFTILPVDSMKKVDDAVAESLKTEIIKTSISDSNLLGIYVAMNSNGVILPNVVTEKEVSQMKKLGLNTYISNDRNNANGNNIAVNDFGGIVNPYVDEKEKKNMEDVLGVELHKMTVAGFSTVGSACMATNSGYFSHFKTSTKEMDEMKDIFKVYGNKGTVNMGTGFVSYGIVVNKNGYLAGDSTSAFEIGRAQEALGLIGGN